VTAGRRDAIVKYLLVPKGLINFHCETRAGAASLPDGDDEIFLSFDLQMRAPSTY